MHAPQPKKHIDPESFKASINQLEEALDDCDTEASEMLTELEQISGGIVFCADRFQNEGGH